MGEMHDRVTRALRNKAVASKDFVTWEEFATVAMEAVRLPTDDMIQAGYDASESGLPLKKIHTAMIDAALRTE